MTIALPVAPATTIPVYIGAPNGKRRCSTAAFAERLRRAAEEVPGESGALDLARALPDAIVILDDGAARAWAARLGIRFVGTVGILIEAKRHGHIDRVAPDPDRLAKLGFRMGPALRQRALAECGEG